MNMIISKSLKLPFIAGMLFSFVLCIGLSGCTTGKKKLKVAIGEIEYAKVCSEVNERDALCQCVKNTFSCSEDKKIFACCSIGWLDKKHTVVFEWIDPSGQVFHKSETIEVSQDNEFRRRGLAYQPLDITKIADLGLTGTWKLNVSVDDKVVNPFIFTLIE